MLSLLMIGFVSMANASTAQEDPPENAPVSDEVSAEETTSDDSETDEPTTTEAKEKEPLSSFTSDRLSSDIWDQLEGLPPTWSNELSVHVIYGLTPFYAHQAPAWVGFGVKVGAGKHYGNHRLGGSFLLSTEGPAPEEYAIGLEPHLAWEGLFGSVLAGASIGPDLVYYAESVLTGADRHYGTAASMSAHLGFSNPWSRVARRTFFYVEPRMKYADGELVPSISLAIGAGRGQ